MTTINISLPEKLKNEAQQLIEKGFYVSFSDLVRHSLRQTVAEDEYDLIFKKTKEDAKRGKAIILKTKKDIKDYFDKL